MEKPATPETQQEPSNSTAQPGTNQSSDPFMRQDPNDLDFLMNAPIIGKKKGSDSVVSDDISTETPTSPEAAAAALAAKGKQEIKKSQQNMQPGKKDSDQKLIKIGDVELSADEWVNAHSALKDKDNTRKFLATLTQKSQLINAFKDDELPDLVAFVTKQKELPKDFRQKAKLPASITVRNMYDEEVEVKTSDLPDDFLNAVKNSVIDSVVPELLDLRKTKSEYEELQSTVESEREVMGREFFTNFMESRNNIKVTIPDGQKLDQVLSALIKDKDHPEHANAIRMLEVMKMSAEEGISPETVYKAKYGKENLKNLSAEQIRKNQQQIIAELPGKAGVDTKTETQKILERDVDPTFGDFQKSMGLRT